VVSTLEMRFKDWMKPEAIKSESSKLEESS